MDSDYPLDRFTPASDKKDVFGKWIFQCILTVFPVIFLGFLIAINGVNIPYLDQWQLVPFIQKMNDGSLRISHLFQQHNEHRLFFPRIIMLSLAHFTNWNIFYELFLNLILGCIIYFFIFLLLRHFSGPLQKNVLPWLFISFSFIVFSPAQWQNWLWGWQIQWYLNVLGLLVTVWSLVGLSRWRRKWVSFLIGITGAVVGTFSLSSGLFIWVVGLMILLVRREDKLYSLIWILTGLAVLFLYFVNYKKPPYHPPLFLFIEHPFEFLLFVLAYIGGGLSQSPKLAYFMGILLFGLFGASFGYLYLRHPGCLKELVGWGGIALYSFLTASATAVGRLGFGMDSALQSRYITISILFLMATSVFFSIALRYFLKTFGEYKMFIRSIAGVLGLSVIFLFAIQYIKGIDKMRELHSYRLELKNCLEFLEGATDLCLKGGFPSNPKMVRDHGKYLEEIGWGGLKPVLSLGSYKIQSGGDNRGKMENVMLIREIDVVIARGWVLIDKQRENPPGVILALDHRPIAKAYWLDEEKQSTGKDANPNMKKLFWEAQFRASVLKEGINRIRAYLVKKEKEIKLLDGQRKILIK